jgi:diacylglycerol kinase family enzyme
MALSAKRRLPPGSTIHVVMNAASGDDDKERSRAALEDAFAARGNPVRFHLIDNPDDIEQTIAEAKQACIDQPGLLVAAGGDGTVNASAAAIAGSDVPFAVIPLGTFNYFARDIGMPLEPAAAATAILDGQIAPMHVARINKRPFLVNASIGLYVRLIQERERHGRKLGRNRVTAVISGLITALRGHYAMHLDMVIDGKSRTVRTPVVFLGKNYLQLKNLDFDIAEGIAAGKIGIITLEDANPLTMIGIAWRTLFGKPEEAQKLNAFCAEKLEIKTRRPLMSVVVDGEIMALQTPLKIEVQRHALLVVRPRPKDAEAEPNSLAVAEGSATSPPPP